jgi:hypothetical protein
VQRDDTHYSPYHYATTGGGHDASDCTNEAAMDHYINNPPWRTGGSSGGAMTRPAGWHQAKKPAEHREKLTGKRVAAEARLDDLLQCKSALEASQAVAREHAERQLPTFARASQNVVATTALLDALSAPSTDGVGEVYEWLKSILGATATQQAESFLLYRVKALILLPADSKDGGQMAT